jgi:hypothetical protein
MQIARVRDLRVGPMRLFAQDIWLGVVLLKDVPRSNLVTAISEAVRAGPLTRHSRLIEE